MNKLFDLTEQQKNIWNTEMFYQGTNVNNIGGYLYIDNKVNFNYLQKCANIYVEHTDSIKYHFVSKGEVIKQYMSDYVPFKVDIVDVANIDAADNLSEQLLNIPFNIMDSDLFKFKIFRLPNGNGGLIGIFHHLISDAWSMGILISRLIDIYSSLIKGEKSFADFPSYSKHIIDSANYLNSEKFNKDKDFWNSIFDKEPELSYIYKNTTSVNYSLDNYAGNREICEINNKLYNKINDFCRDNNVSIYTFFLAIFSLYLSKINDTSSATIGTPVLNRANFNEKQTAGMFVSNIPFKINIDQRTNFITFLKNVALNQATFYRHQRYPYLNLLKDVKEKYDMSENLYDFVLSYQNIRDNKNSSDISYTSKWLTNLNVSNSIEAHFYDMDDSGRVHIYYNYQTNKFSKNDIIHLNDRIMAIAQYALKNPILKDISVLSNYDTNIIDSFNNTYYKYNKKESIIDLFEKQVRKNRNKTAVIFKNENLTYSQLDLQSNKVANMLLSLGIHKNDVVGIMLNRSFDLHIAMWGILKTGASYMLIDPALPEERINYMLSNANSPLVVTDLYLNYKTISLKSSAEYSDKLPKIHVSNEDRFCVLYTSGSTGTPKGVELRKLSVLNLINSFKYKLNTYKCNMYLSTSTVAFDMFMVENFLGILSGKTVVLADEDEQKIPAYTAKLIVDNNVDFIVSTPSKIALLLEESDCLRNVKVIQLGGEVFKPALYDALNKVTNAEIHNGYGPSECCACSSDKLIVNSNDINIGTPYYNVKMFIMNHNNDILPVNVPGELVILGDGVGLGYINKSEFNGIYRTGDIAELSSNGNLIYYGRQDNQIKLHGLRIELDEITEKILKIDSISNAVSVIKKVNNIDCICSYVETSNSNLTEKKIKKELSKVLPNYMIPVHVVFMDKFNITLNGKIDSKNLPNIVVKEADFHKASSDIEKQLEKIWCNILNLPSISILDNFFELGGDSLCSIRLVSEIYSKLNVKIEIKDIFEHPTISDLAKFISTTDLSINNIAQNAIQHHREADFYPVSSAQRRIYYTVNMNTDSLAYNTPFGILFNKIPNVEKLNSIFQQILNNHDAFKTYFVLQGTDVVQKIVDQIDFKLNVVNFKNDDFVKPFELNKAPLLHAELDLFDNKALLQIDIHHIICDGVSIGIFAKEFCDLYNNNAIQENDIDYIDYSISEKINPLDKDYWVSLFSNNIPLLNMPTVYERTSIKSEEGASLFDKITDINKINNFCKSLNITPYMFLLSAYYIILYKYTMQNDLIIGTPIVGRENLKLSNIIGMFVNTLALRQNIQSTNTFNDFVNLVKDNCINAFAHQTYPFDDLLKNLNIPRDTSRSPLFDVMFIYESEGLPKLKLKDNSAQYIIPDNHTSKFDFSLEITPSDEAYNIRLEYATKLYNEDFMKEFLSSYKNIINTVLDDGNIQISKIKLLTDAPELYPILDYPKNLRIIDLFEKQVLESPDNIALVCGNDKFTYKELEIRVNRLANHIKNSKLFKEVISKMDNKVIGIMMNRRSELLISMLAILKVGAGYLPIDPAYPSDRIKYIVDDSNINIILTESGLAETIKSINPDIFTVLVDVEKSYDSYLPFDTSTSPSDISYMIYTSGSTGKPKGVMLKQSSVVNFIYGMTDRIPLKDKTIVSITTMCFDIFVLESLLPVCTGMKVIMANNEEQNNPILLNKLCLENHVQVIQTTPSKFKFLMSDENSLEYIKNMQIISLAGEPFPLDLYKSIKNISDSRVFNMYGPTETTVGSTLKELTSLSEDVTIGTPISNTIALVLDNDMNPVPINVPGTLYIGGDGVSIGYMNKPELTAERYINYNGMRIYNSGDLVKILPNGEIYCLGRADFQVKIRGLRIELGEIEKDICSFPGISDSVTTVKNINGRDVLCGYFVATGRISISLLKNRLAKKLPNYMVPSYLIQLDSFSYTPNGKIDRKVLPLPVFKDKEIIAPKTQLQRQLLVIWKSILSIDEISIDDNFFEIGGDSLCALRLQLELMKLGFSINYGDIFKNNTIISLSSFIDIGNSNMLLPKYTKRDFKHLNKILSKNNSVFKMKLRERPIKNVLLIGATGFLGIHVLAELLKVDNIMVYCLIREDPSTSPENKLKNKFKYYFGSDLSNLFGTRLFVMNGDITKENFGMSSEQYEFLGNSVYTVINCAALVKHYGNYSDFEKINVTGVKNIVYFCEKYNHEFIHTSTISVSGNTMTNLPGSYNPNKIIYFGENKLFINQSFENVYVRSKFEAEKFVLEELSNKKLTGIILRIGNITNRFSDGKFQENSEDNAFLNRLKAFISLGVFPKSMINDKDYIEFSPVDKVAESIIYSIKYYSRSMSILHIYNSKHLYISKLYNILIDLDIDIKIIDDSSFKKILTTWLYDNSKSDKVSVLLNDLDKDTNLIYRTNLVITNKFTNKFFNKIKFEWPEINKEYIKKIINNF